LVTRTSNLHAIDVNLWDITKGGWNVARQFIVPLEIQNLELGQEAKFGWNKTRQFVVEQPQQRELVQETKLGWKRT